MVHQIVSRGLRPTPPPRLRSIFVLAQMCVWVCLPPCCVVVGCSRIMFLGPLLGIPSSRFYLHSLRTSCAKYARIWFKSQKVFLEVPQISNGGPLSTKNAPTSKNKNRIARDRPPFRDCCWNMLCRKFGKNMFGRLLLSRDCF